MRKKNEFQHPFASFPQNCGKREVGRVIAHGLCRLWQGATEPDWRVRAHNPNESLFWHDNLDVWNCWNNLSVS